MKAAELVVRAPGRVNLIGDHTDYNDGLVLPMAIDRDCLVAVRSRADNRVVARSREQEGLVELSLDGPIESGTIEPSWGRFVAGVIGALLDRGAAPRGLDVAVSSTVPLGSGLSSSSALSVALTMAIAETWGVRFDRRDLARAALDAEVRATGVPGGLMDQLASIFGEPGHALLIDCRTLSIEPVPIPDTIGVLVVHSGMSRTLAGSAYAQRRAECEAIAADLGLSSLRDATAGQVADRPRARHVVSENRRVEEFARALRSNDIGALGPLLVQSHASLRDDYDVSIPELDTLVDILVGAGALGARLTGAGFGGCVVALAQRNHLDDLAAKTAVRYRELTGREATTFACRAVAGAHDVASGPGGAP